MTWSIYSEKQDTATGMINEIFNLKVPHFPQALCKEVGFGDLWFPETREEISTFTPQAKKICGGCHHSDECLKYAIDEGIPDGIWGGLTRRERLKLIPRRPNGKPINNMGQRVYEFRKQGFSYPWIASRLTTTQTAAVQALTRYKKRMGIGDDE